MIAKREKCTWSQVDKVMVQRYEKVAKSRGGQAVAPLRENICQGCFQQTLPQMVINVKVGDIHPCNAQVVCVFYIGKKFLKPQRRSKPGDRCFGFMAGREESPGSTGQDTP